MKMTKMIFVRHGQSVANLEKVFAGHTDTVLTELGHKQAACTAEFLRDYPIDAIYASDLTRAMQTAAPTAAAHGLEVIPDVFLREVFAGDWEGLPYETLMERFSESYTVWRTDCGRAHPENGESVVELSRRICGEVERIAKAHPDGCVAIFTHATPIRALCARWAGYAAEDIARVSFCPNASVSVVDYLDDGTFTVHLCGYDGHQGENSTGLLKGIV